MNATLAELARITADHASAADRQAALAAAIAEHEAAIGVLSAARSAAVAEVVTDAGSIRKAAAVLGLSPTAVHKISSRTQPINGGTR